MTRRLRESGDVSDVEYLVLQTLTHGPLYGYAIKKDVESRTNGRSKLSLASLYAALHRLLDDGLVDRDKEKIVEGRARQTYRITGLGQEAFSERTGLLLAMIGADHRDSARGEV